MEQVIINGALGALGTLLGLLYAVHEWNYRKFQESLAEQRREDLKAISSLRVDDRVNNAKELAHLRELLTAKHEDTTKTLAKIRDDIDYHRAESEKKDQAFWDAVNTAKTRDLQLESDAKLRHEELKLLLAQTYVTRAEMDAAIVLRAQALLTQHH